MHWPLAAMASLSAAHLLPLTGSVIDLPAVLPADLELRQNSAFPEGADCAGSDGIWNCLTTSWQRCVNDNWTSIITAAAGTMCKPAGISFDFHVFQISDTVVITNMATASETVCVCKPTTSTVHPLSCSSTTAAATTTTMSTLPSTCTPTAARSTYETTGGELVSGSAAIDSRVLATAAGVGLLAIVFARLLM